MTPLDRALAKLGRAIEANRPPGPRFHHAACGRRRPFLSLSDAHSYEAAFYAFRDGAPCPEFGPGRDGWRDAEGEANETREQMRANSYEVWVRRNCNPLRGGDGSEVGCEFDEVVR